MTEAQYIYEFGLFRVDPNTMRLFKEGQHIALSQKAFDLLLLLVPSKGRTLSKQFLLNELWPDVNVSEHNLTQTISVLRKALGETAGEHRFIMTVPGSGYRFVAEVRSLPFKLDSERETSDSPVDGARPLLNRSSRIWSVALGGFALLLLAVGAMVTLVFLTRGKPSLVGFRKPPELMAVMPFRTLDDESSRAKLGTGLTDALIKRLSSTTDVRVSPMTDVLKYDCPKTNLVGAGRALGADSVVEGRVQKIADRVRVTVQIMRVSDGRTMWTDMVDEDFTDTFSLEDRVSEKLAPRITQAIR